MNKNKIKNIFLDHSIEILLLIIVIFMSFASPTFLTVSNILNIFRNMSMKGVIAFGMTMVIISGQIDLSVGSQVALAGVIVARVCQDLPASLGVSLNVACIIGMLLALLLSLAIGGLHTVAQHKFGMPSFIITLATLNLMYGIAGMICDGFPIANAYPDWFLFLGSGKIGVVPVPAIILILVFAFSFFLMRYTTTGRSVYAVGGNAESARLSGINVGKTKFISFALIQVFCVLAAFMNSAQLASGSYSFGKGWEVDVVSATVIGGTAMDGGVGNPWGTLMGILFLGVINNGMTIMNVDIYMQYVIRASIMIFAVLISTMRAKAKA